jgi:hypothetical protein
MKLGVAVVQLEKPPVAAAGLVASELLWQPRLQGLAQSAEEVTRGEQSRAYQPAEYIS